MTKRNLCSLHLKSFTIILLSLPLCRSIKSIFLFLHLFAASVSFSTKHCLSSSMSWTFTGIWTYLELRRISTTRHYLSVDASKTLICAFVLSRIDDCNALLAGIPTYLLDRLQQIGITLHVLSSNLQSIAMFPLFFAQCTGFQSPREQIISFPPCVSLSLMAQAQNTCLNCFDSLHPFSTHSFCFRY